MSTKKPVPAAKGPVHTLFNFDDSDITLRSSDGVHFRVHKGRLAAASLFFQEMFEGGLGTPGAPKNDIPQLAERADTLAVLFAMCYPFDTDNAPFDLISMDPALLMSCYEASEKYNMWVAQQIMQHLIMPLVEKDPFRLVQTGYVLRKQNLLSTAARATLAYDIVADGAEYREKAGNTWAALLQYHISYKRAVTKTIHGMSCTLGSRAEGEKQFYCNASNRYHEYCENAKSQQIEWQVFRYGLAVQPTPGWPKDALLLFIDRRLDLPSVRNCTGCTKTWKELRERASRFEPAITLTLEQIDRSLS